MYKAEPSDSNENPEHRGGIFCSRNYAPTLSAVGTINDAVIHFNAAPTAVSLRGSWRSEKFTKSGYFNGATEGGTSSLRETVSTKNQGQSWSYLPCG